MTIACRATESRDKVRRDMYNGFSSNRYVQRWQKHLQPLSEPPCR